MNHEDEWVRTLLREHEELEYARRIQPGRGHPVKHARSDWWVLLAIITAILLGLVL